MATNNLFEEIFDENFEKVVSFSDEEWEKFVKPITPGSFCTGSIIIERKPPTEKVFYKLSQWLRSR